MRKLIRGLALTTMLFASSVSAEVEDWYAYWGIGLSDTSYPSGLDSALDAMAALPGTYRLEVTVDAFGFYWPLPDEKTILGFVVSGSGDRIFDSADFLQVNTYLYSLSTMHFLGSQPGDGLFFRGDVGISKAVITSSVIPDQISDSGSGFLIGIGYGISTSGSSLLFNLNYANKTIESETYSTIGISAGILW